MEVLPKFKFVVPNVFDVLPKVDPNIPIPGVLPKIPPGFCAVFPNNEVVFAKVPPPNVPVFCILPNEKLLVVGLKTDVEVAVDVPKVFDVPKPVPKPVAGVVPKPVVAGFASKKPVLVVVLEGKVNPTVVVGFRLKVVAGLFPNNPID